MRTMTPSRTKTLRRQRPPQLWEGHPVRIMRSSDGARSTRAWRGSRRRNPAASPFEDAAAEPTRALHRRKPRRLIVAVSIFFPSAGVFMACRPSEDRDVFDFHTGMPPKDGLRMAMGPGLQAQTEKTGTFPPLPF